MFNEIPKAENKSEKSFDFENWLSSEFPEQYETQAKILNQSGILEILPHAKDIGIFDISGMERPFPEIETIRDMILEKKEFFERKMRQGFTELQITPISALDKLRTCAREIILKHHREGKLFAARANPDDPNEPLVPLELNEDEPLWVWNEYRGADKSGKLIYFPQEFNQDPKIHQGKTKEEVMRLMGDSRLSGYLVTLREKNINIPRAGKGQIIGGRKQLETNKTPSEYLKIFQNEIQYQGEEGDTTEEWIIKMITQLEKTNEMIDDYQGNGSISYQTGTYFPASGAVPSADWSQDSRQANLYGSNPYYRNVSIGVRPAVRVNKI